jgi:hypothetical protein
MNRMADLTSALLDLLHELEDTDIKLIVGGGFGIYLRHREFLRMHSRTLLRELPEPRSTNDLDLFLRAELLVDPERVMALSRALDRLGYEAVETARYYQFLKKGPEGGSAGSMKIDILTGPERIFEAMGLRTDPRRVRPKSSAHLHAHPVNEALTLEEGLTSVRVDGRLSTGEVAEGEIFLPHSFTFLMMKLFAFRDCMNDAAKDYGRHHAIDMYTIVAMMTEVDWDSSVAMYVEHRSDPKIEEACGLIAKLFGSELDFGALRLKENAYYRPEFQVADFLQALRDLFKGRA